MSQPRGGGGQDGYRSEKKGSAGRGDLTPAASSPPTTSLFAARAILPAAIPPAPPTPERGGPRSPRVDRASPGRRPERRFLAATPGRGHAGLDSPRLPARSPKIFLSWHVELATPCSGIRSAGLESPGRPKGERERNMQVIRSRWGWLRRIWQESVPICRNCAAGRNMSRRFVLHRRGNLVGAKVEIPSAPPGASS